MAKGKHAPAPGAVREDKVLHPNSRKAKKLQRDTLHRLGINEVFVYLSRSIASFRLWYIHVNR